MSDRDGRWDEFEAGKKQGRIDLLEELAATKMLVSMPEYEALTDCAFAMARILADVEKAKKAIIALDKARGKL